jgi:hypothetical protein
VWWLVTKVPGSGVGLVIGELDTKNEQEIYLPTRSWLEIIKSSSEFERFSNNYSSPFIFFPFLLLIMIREGARRGGAQGGLLRASRAADLTQLETPAQKLKELN